MTFATLHKTGKRFDSIDLLIILVKTAIIENFKNLIVLIDIESLPVDFLFDNLFINNWTSFSVIKGIDVIIQNTIAIFVFFQP